MTNNPSFTAEQQAALCEAQQQAIRDEVERKTRILESGQPADEFLELVSELGPGMQGLTPGQLYLNWLWGNGYEIEEWSDISDAITYCIGKIPVTEIVKTYFPDYHSAEYVYLDHDNQGFISELTEEQAKAAIEQLEKDNELYAAAEDEFHEQLTSGDTTFDLIHRC